MLYLGTLTIGFVDYGLAVVKHSRNRRAPEIYTVFDLPQGAGIARRPRKTP